MPFNVVSVREVPKMSGRVEVGQTVTGNLDRFFQVVFSAPGWIDVDAYGANDGKVVVPPAGDSKGGKVLTIKSLRQIDLVTAEVTCSYTVLQPGQEPKPDDPAVERWAIDIRVDGIPYEIETQSDNINNPIDNAAGDYLSGVMTPKSDYDILISFNCVAIDWESIDECQDCINDADFALVINGQSRTFGVGTIRFMNPSISYILDPSSVTYPRVTYRLRYRKETWVKKLANAGLNYYDATAGKLMPIKNGQNDNIQSPVYLKADGSGPLTAGSAVNFRFFNIYNTANLLDVLLWDLAS